MKEILPYLLNPNKAGVYLSTVSIEISELKELFREILKFDKETDARSIGRLILLERDSMVTTPPSRLLTNWAIEDLKKAVSHLNIYTPKEGILSSKILMPRGHILLSANRMGFIRDKGIIDASASAYFSDAFLNPNIALLKTMDALKVSPVADSETLRINIFSVKKNGVKIFEKFIRSIPIIGEKAGIVDRGKRHSSRHCYEPYPAAVILWSCNIVYKSIPDDVLNFFDGAVRYFEKEEWRISIILSAIAVESLLAEIYEEYFHEIAPPDPLGALRDKIEKKQKLPPETRNDVDVVNQSRIAAVHRSSMQVGEKEARNAMIGAVRFTNWAFSEGPLSD